MSRPRSEIAAEIRVNTVGLMTAATVLDYSDHVSPRSRPVAARNKEELVSATNKTIARVRELLVELEAAFNA